MKPNLTSLFFGCVTAILIGLLIHAQVQRAEQTKILRQTQMLLVWNNMHPSNFTVERAFKREPVKQTDKLKAYDEWAQARIWKFNWFYGKPRPGRDVIPMDEISTRRSDERLAEERPLLRNDDAFVYAQAFLFPIDPQYLSASTRMDLHRAVERIVLDFEPEGVDGLQAVYVLARFEAEIKYKTPDDTLPDPSPEPAALVREGQLKLPKKPFFN